MREISLNAFKQLKSGESALTKTQYSKLEIPVELRVEGGDQTEIKMEKCVSSCRIMNNCLNSTCMLQYSYMPTTSNEVSLIAALQGPTESKFASK